MASEAVSQQWSTPITLYAGTSFSFTTFTPTHALVCLKQRKNVYKTNNKQQTNLLQHI